MKHGRYYPNRHADRIAWLTNFRLKLPGYAAALGLTAGQVAAAVADCGWLQYLLESWLPGTRPWSKACTDANRAAESGTGTEAMTLPVFTAPALPAGVAAVTPGARDRIFALVRVIKSSGKLTVATAADLGLIGTAASGPDLNAVTPVITARVSGGAVHLGWGYQGNRAWLSGCEIHVDRADGKGFVLLMMDTTPDYVDTQPFPAGKTVWSYKAIYRAGDTQAGQWSQVVSVAVG